MTRLRITVAAAVAAVAIAAARPGAAETLTAQKLEGLKSYAEICARYEATAHACGAQKLFVPSVRGKFLEAARSDGVSRGQAAQLNGVWLYTFQNMRKSQPTLACSEKGLRTLQQIAARCATLFKGPGTARAARPEK